MAGLILKEQFYWRHTVSKYRKIECLQRWNDKADKLKDNIGNDQKKNKKTKCQSWENIVALDPDVYINFTVKIKTIHYKSGPEMTIKSAE